MPLNMVKDWSVSPDEISRRDGKYFKVIGVNVTISNREVVSWQQPMIQPAQLGICAFVCKKINGVIHFIVQAKLECGNRDIIELAPTVQCLTGDYDAADSEPVPFLAYVLASTKENILFDALQSEEGGRFYREQNRNVIVLADDTFPNQLPEQYIWMTLNQLTFFNRFNNYLNIQVRSLMAAISFT
jgi:oxidase EvaA